MWVIRLGIIALILGVAIRFGPCFAEDYVIDFYSPEGSYVLVDEFSANAETCSTDPWWFIPSFSGTCFANTQNCSAASGFLLYASKSDSCTGTDVCCYLFPNTTMPAMTTPSMTQTGLPNCTLPTMPGLDPSSAQGALQPPNCTVVPTMPTAVQTTPSIG